MAERVDVCHDVAAIVAAAAAATSSSSDGGGSTEKSCLFRHEEVNTTIAKELENTNILDIYIR